MKSRSVTATEFKAKCLSILDEVDSTGAIVTITKRGRPVATVQRAKKTAWRSLEGVLAGQIDFDELGDTMSPPVCVEWDPPEYILNPENRPIPRKQRKSA